MLKTFINTLRNEGWVRPNSANDNSANYNSAVCYLDKADRCKFCSPSFLLCMVVLHVSVWAWCKSADALLSLLHMTWSTGTILPTHSNFHELDRKKKHLLKDAKFNHLPQVSIEEVSLFASVSANSESC